MMKNYFANLAEYSHVIAVLRVTSSPQVVKLSWQHAQLYFSYSHWLGGSIVLTPPYG